jgi:hypothetical protein
LAACEEALVILFIVGVLILSLGVGSIVIIVSVIFIEVGSVVVVGPL